MRIAVTGAGGRLGRPVVEAAVAAGHAVVALDRTPAEGERAGVEARTVDLLDYDDLRAALEGCDGLVHLAAYTNPRDVPEPGVHHNNVMSSYNALAAATASGIERICVASSVNAIGGVYSARPRFDYFPLDEDHPAYPEDAYSLSKLAAEQQAAAFARRCGNLSVSCLRLHALRDRDEMAAWFGATPERAAKDLWGYTPLAAASAACLSALTADVDGCEVLYVVAEDTYLDLESEELRRRFHPEVPVRGDLSGHRSFFDSRRAARLLA